MRRESTEIEEIGISALPRIRTPLTPDSSCRNGTGITGAIYCCLPSFPSRPGAPTA